MISGYYTALERTMFVGEVDAASLAGMAGERRRARTGHSR